jgi:hypothetical protein
MPELCARSTRTIPSPMTSTSTSTSVFASRARWF